ncbi:Mitochondrial escape protein [Colletotrichum higginsianum IMI 349063]|uniref:Mitochondrial escape protein 2 n=3 Tax=Colletotrichum higginsianum TaxID=80884 RepID=A0A1B7Y281_COLHI|nr:Mitochondrial escape protein [Colletotrichum higginsianum IMI 349063]OBR06087.1 Mitochondrial escape protein [Colletotrichum higginsianum IMI 349063]TIC97697.1 Mitochondrial escape protein 2 [Colletotrichum higginsianum]
MFRSGMRPAAKLRATWVPTRPFAQPQRPGAVLRAATKAWESTLTGDEKSGHIAKSDSESILFFDNLFPLKLTYLLRRSWSTDRDLTDLLKRFDSSSGGLGTDPINLVKRAIPNDLPIKVTEILPRLKDGGAFVKFSHGSDVVPKDIENSLAQSLEKRPLRPWFNPFRGVKAGLVRGVPWLEDLYRFPKSRVKIEFTGKDAGAEAVELSQETLYSVFRRYGKIAEITSQPSDSKILPKYAYVDFALVRDAIMARNCLHGFVVDEALGGGKLGTRLRLSYEQKVKPHNIWNWLTSHPRVVIPVVAALLAAFTVAVFDPIREFFVKAHIQHSFRLTNNKLYRWIKNQTSDIISSFGHKKADKAGFNAVWQHRRDLIEQIQTWLLESSDTFIVVQGPRGSGKKELVLDQSLKGRKNVLVIDCKPIIEARGESGTIKHLANAVGYKPIFAFLNNMSSMIDLAVQSTTGVKAGFSETLESQVVKILHTTAEALKEVSLAGRDKDGKDGDLSDDAYLEARPDKRAVVVIDNFLHKNEGSSIVYDKVAEWAAAMVQNNVAHVIFLTDDTAYSKSLSKAMPDRVFRQASLGDLSLDVAKKFIISRLEEDELDKVREHSKEANEKTEDAVETHEKPDLSELDSAIGILGGRLTDLEYLARRLKGGQSPQRAIEDIINQSATEIVKMYLLDGKDTFEGKKWSMEQAWYLIKELASHEALRYNEVLLSDTFASSTTAGASNGESALEGLTNAELITVETYNGRPQTIRPGKPMYQAAFSLLLDDRVLRAKLDLAMLKELTKVETKTIEKAENELALLGSLPKQPSQTGARVSYLLDKLEGSQTKITKYEKEIAALKKVLKHNY